MAAPTQYYVDPSIAGDSGAGTVGDPYGDLEYCLEQITRDATNGDQVNIKTGSTETLEFALDIPTDYGAPTKTAPLIFRGYTTAANDGGIGIISGGGAVSIVDGTDPYVHFADMHLTNVGARTIVTLGDAALLYNCEIDTSTGGSAVVVGQDGKVTNCYLHTLTGTIGITVSHDCHIVGNLVAAAVTTAGISTATNPAIISNIVKLVATNAADGIRWGDNATVMNNSVFATAGTGSGFVGAGSGTDTMSIINNIAEGFSGAGGDGFDWSSTDHTQLWGHNAVFNCTNVANKTTGDIHVDIGGDDIPLAASPFADPGNLDFSVGTEVKATAMPNFTGGGTTPGTTQFVDVGGAQREEAGAGGGRAVILGG